MPRRNFAQQRRFDLAAGHGIGAAGVEMAARRRIHRTRHIALQHEFLALDGGVRHRYGREQRLDLRALMEGKASDPMQWPEPFQDAGDAPLYWTEAEPGHFVRMTREDA